MYVCMYIYWADQKDKVCFIFHKVARVLLYGHSYKEYCVNLLLFLFHSKLQKVKITFLHNSIHSQHNDRLKDVRSYYILHG